MSDEDRMGRAELLAEIARLRTKLPRCSICGELADYEVETFTEDSNGGVQYSCSSHEMAVRGAALKAARELRSERDRPESAILDKLMTIACRLDAYTSCYDGRLPSYVPTDIVDALKDGLEKLRSVGAKTVCAECKEPYGHAWNCSFRPGESPVEATRRVKACPMTGHPCNCTMGGEGHWCAGSLPPRDRKGLPDEVPAKDAIDMLHAVQMGQREWAHPAEAMCPNCVFDAKCIYHLGVERGLVSAAGKAVRGSAEATLDEYHEALLDMKKKAAETCEYFAHMLERGAGDYPPGARLRQAARHILASEWRSVVPESTEDRSAEATQVSMPLESHLKLIRERDESVALRIHLWACKKCMFCPEHIGQIKPLQDRPNEGPHTSQIAPNAPRWRTGRKLGRTLYEGENFEGLLESVEVADLVVKALNEHQDRRRESDQSGDMVPRAWMREHVRKARDFERDLTLEEAAQVAVDEELWTEEPGRLEESERRIVVGALQSVARAIRAKKSGSDSSCAGEKAKT